ncbi:hypothetical protein SprV_0902684200 [Sparganum proliferum]
MHPSSTPAPNPTASPTATTTTGVPIAYGSPPSKIATSIIPATVPGTVMSTSTTPPGVPSATTLVAQTPLPSAMGTGYQPALTAAATPRHASVGLATCKSVTMVATNKCQEH